MASMLLLSTAMEEEEGWPPTTTEEEEGVTVYDGRRGRRAIASNSGRDRGGFQQRKMLPMGSTPSKKSNIIVVF